jgi:hypothetical protein
VLINVKKTKILLIFLLVFGLLIFTYIYLNTDYFKKDSDPSVVVVGLFNSLNNNNYQRACSLISDRAINDQQLIYRETDTQDNPEPINRKDYCISDLDSVFNFNAQQVNQITVREITVSGEPEAISEENQDFVLLPVVFTVSANIYDFNKQLVVKRIPAQVKIPINKEARQWKIQSITSLFPRQLVSRKFKELYLKDAQKILLQSQQPIRESNSNNLVCPRPKKLLLNQKKILDPKEKADIKKVLFTDISKLNKVCLLIDFQLKTPEQFSVYLETPVDQTTSSANDYKYSFYVRNKILLATRSEFAGTLTNEPILAQAIKNKNQLKITFAVPDSTKAEPLQPIEEKEVTVVKNSFWPSGY